MGCGQRTRIYLHTCIRFGCLKLFLDNPHFGHVFDIIMFCNFCNTLLDTEHFLGRLGHSLDTLSLYMHFQYLCTKAGALLLRVGSLSIRSTGQFLPTPKIQPHPQAVSSKRATGKAGNGKQEFA